MKAERATTSYASWAFASLLVSCQAQGIPGVSTTRCPCASGKALNVSVPPVRGEPAGLFALRAYLAGVWDAQGACVEADACALPVVLGLSRVGPFSADSGRSQCGGCLC